MKRKINRPDVAIDMSINAYHQAKEEYNQAQKNMFLKGKRKELPKTIHSLLLKDTHHHLFYTILKYYREKLHNMIIIFNGSNNISTYIKHPISMYVKTGRIAKHLNRTNSAIRERLRRLEKADIIKVIFHGHKKPLEIIFSKHICLIFDKDKPLNIPKSKFLKGSKTDAYSIYGKKPHNKESTLTRTKYNITIPKKTTNTFTGTTKADSPKTKNLKPLHKVNDKRKIVTIKKKSG